MKKVLLSALLLIAAPAQVWAAQVYGSLKVNGQPVGARVRIEIGCAGGSFAGETDQYGAYRINVPETGKCTLKLNYGNQVVSYAIHSYDQPVRYDFDLVMENGKYALRRR